MTKTAPALEPHPIADIICAWANGFRAEFRYRHHNPGNPEQIYLSDERWHLCGKSYSAWSGVNEHRIHADDLAAWEAFKRPASPAAPAQQADPVAWTDQAILSLLRANGDGPYSPEDIATTRAFMRRAEEIRSELLAASPQPSAQGTGLTDEQLIDIIAAGLSGTYHCTRVWEAWHVGTMTEDDFCPVDESDTPGEIAQAIRAALAQAPAAEPVAGLLEAATEAAGVLTFAARDVLLERERQITAEGYNAAEDDDNNDAGQLAEAAACYAARQRPAGMCPPYWPWDADAWKPKDRRSDLVRAGALILAEIERLDRAA